MSATIELDEQRRSALAKVARRQASRYRLGLGSVSDKSQKLQKAARPMAFLKRVH